MSSSDKKSQDPQLKSSEDAPALSLLERTNAILDARGGALEATDGISKTFQFTQHEIKSQVDLRTLKKSYNLQLNNLGPYRLGYTLNGRHLALAGRKGHIALLDWQRMKLMSEWNVNDTVRDVAFLHNHTMVAVAQKQFVYVYDNTGMEIHVLRNHIEPTRLTFLPYHFLLASVGKSGYLKYHDTSTGQIVAELRTRYGACDVLTHNPQNAVVACGHSNGRMTLWSPNQSKALVTLMCHRGPVLGTAFSVANPYFVTSGLDGQVHVWDTRTYKKLHSYFTRRPATVVQLSQKDMLCLGFGSSVQIWKDALRVKQKSPYLSHRLNNGAQIGNAAFVPYEDFCGIAHSKGFTSMLVPGSGNPNFDVFEQNPFENSKQGREGVVHKLLDKLQPDMITLHGNPYGVMDTESKELYAGSRKSMREKRQEQSLQKSMSRKRARGRNKTGKRERRKRRNIIDKQSEERREAAERRQKELEQRKKESLKGTTQRRKNETVDVLERFQ